MTKSLETITSNIYLGLREDYSDKVHSIDELNDFLQEHTNQRGFCVTVTPTTFIYKDSREDGAIIGIINYPRFPSTREKLEEITNEIALLCKDKFKQNRVTYIFMEKTVMIE